MPETPRAADSTLKNPIRQFRQGQSVGAAPEVLLLVTAQTYLLIHDLKATGPPVPVLPGPPSACWRAPALPMNYLQPVLRGFQVSTERQWLRAGSESEMAQWTVVLDVQAILTSLATMSWVEPTIRPVGWA